MEHLTSTQTEPLIEDLLSRAAAAHGVYERDELDGVHDADWPAWYARRMARELHASGYRIVLEAAA